MKNSFKSELEVQGNKIGVMIIDGMEYISLTDLAKYADPDEPSEIIRNWMSNKNSFAFYSLWEEVSNPNFNSVESHRIKIEEVPYNRFTMTPSRWKKRYNAIGIIPGSGKYSNGTFAHQDIAFEFASWLSPEFKLYLIKEFQRLKKSETYQAKVEWQANRLLSKLNYVVHTDAIKKYIVPSLSEKQINYVYADEADVINVALFGMSAKEWRDSNPSLAKNANMRDYADLFHLIILNNLENINAELISMNVKQKDRLIRLNEVARNQLNILNSNINVKRLESLNK